MRDRGASVGLRSFSLGALVWLILAGASDAIAGPPRFQIRIETNDPEFPVLSVPVSGLVLPSPATK
jgi:hypothetical protein